MAVKNKKTNSRTYSKSNSKLTQFKFRWWMALVLVGVVAVLGIVILRFSYAGGQLGTIRSNNGYGGLRIELCVAGRCQDGYYADAQLNSSTGLFNISCPRYGFPYAGTAQIHTGGIKPGWAVGQTVVIENSPCAQN